MKRPILCVLVISLMALVGATVYAAVTESSVDVPKAIPDNVPAGVLSALTFSVAGTITDVNVTVNIAHTYNADLDIYLQNPSAVEVELSTDNGGTSDNFTDTVFDDEAATSITAGTAPYTGSFIPEGTLAPFDGGASAGTWNLRAADDSAALTGTINAWSLTLDGPPPLPVELMSFDVQ